MKRFLIFVTLLLASMSLQAGELVFHWNKICENKIFDMELMPDNDYFVVVTANEFQVRKTEDGEIVKTYPKMVDYSQYDIEFTPDSNYLIMSYGWVIEKRNVEDLSIVKSYTMPEPEPNYSQRFLEIEIDPKKPYIYALQVKWWDGEPGLGISEYRVIVYNYETLEKVTDITPTGFENKVYEHIAISKDGKYLSFINQGESYLVTIDLSTQKELQKFRICKNYSDGGGSGGVPVCIKFSELNSDKIYFTGNFPQSIDGKNNYYGLLVYSISENKIIDSTFSFGGNKIYNSKFTFFDNESKAIATNGVYIYILDFKNYNFLFNNIINSDMGGIALQIIYNKNNLYFIGRSEKMISRFIYKDDVLVKEFNNIFKALYPNPTNGLINIELNCISNKNYYELCDSNGLLIKRATIDNNYPATNTLDNF
ncbi:MAG TPA: hypothetical protein PKY56_11890 [Candidatus Kapabacteria bacterium]|nr:hypothetical protein [Candidatus Kapabacteria bacterium]